MFVGRYLDSSKYRQLLRTVSQWGNGAEPRMGSQILVLANLLGSEGNLSCVRKGLPIQLCTVDTRESNQ